MPTPFIAHIDADCYYVSAERVRFPHLTGVPVGVIGNQGACVIAKSYEMKAAGVRTGDPVWEAIAKCPEGVYIKRDFAWYEVLSRKMLEVTRQLSPCVEFYSIDEFFAVVPDAQSEAEAAAFAQKVRQTIWQEVGVPVTVGIGRSRTLAKLFSDTAKPNGSTAIVCPDKEEAYLKRMPVTEIAGIGGRRAKRLEAYGIRSCWDFAQANRLIIRDVLTIVGEQLWWELNGTSVLPVRPGRPQHKQIARGGSVAGRVRQFPVMQAWVIRNLERLVEALEFYEVYACVLDLILNHEGAPTMVARAHLDSAGQSYEDLLDAALRCLKQAWQPGWEVTHMHLIAGDLREKGKRPTSLFDDTDTKRAPLAELKRNVNSRFGRWKLRAGTTLYLPQIYADSANSTEVCDIAGKFCF